MIYDLGKLIITLVCLIGLFGVLIFGGREDSPQAWALIGALIGYVFANGKQLIAPFAPSPMLIAKPGAPEAANHEDA